MSSLVDLLRRMVSIDSVNPDLMAGGAGEGRVAAAVARWLHEAGLEVALTDVLPGRPNVIARPRGAVQGPALLLLAHTDTVGAAGMERPFEPQIDDDRLSGRGAYDMKSGLTAAMSAIAGLADTGLDVTLAAVCDEEAGESGTKPPARLGTQV